ncbi:DNRLRE domain-containing protein [Nocardioides sp. JQ2195]|uniref:DNRLRE domain-containing protein n=1 Tax=Nocardioides sp. JQ2195 TaxID=2592334 RepID=UPI00143E58B2|nr:DNRLRE domain-containing protein [Nocardioides sp. JQ2195]QIX26998.1 DNRLRE domain-containing protein [Nocardioides sp. JQ2195]
MTGAAELVETPNGGVEINTPAGETIATAAAPLMWEGNPATNPVDSNVAPVGVEVSAPASGESLLTLTPDTEFLNDPATTYPVTIDPTFTLTEAGSAYISSPERQGWVMNDPELRVGTNDLGATKYRSLLKFNDTTWVGKDITSAALKLRNFSSVSCTGAEIQVRRLSDTWSPSNVTWANQPEGTTAGQASYSPAHGGPDCATADATWDLTTIVGGWADQTYPNRGLKLRAADETINKSYRKYRSSYIADTSLRPRLIVTYNVVPSVPEPGFTPCLAPCEAETAFTESLRPTIIASSLDDSGLLTYTFEIVEEDTSAVVATGTATGASGESVSWQIPDGALANESVYLYRVSASDGSYSSRSDWLMLGVDVDETPQIPIEALTLSPCLDLCEPAIATSEEVVLVATPDDPDSGALTPQMELREVGSSSLLASATGQRAPTEAPAEFTIEDGTLESGKTYEFRIGAADETSTTWSQWKTFQVQLQTGPEAPENLTIDPCMAPCDQLRTDEVTPTISATNPGELAIDLTVEIDAASGETIATHTISNVQGGETTSWTVPAGTLGTGVYSVHASSSSTSGNNWGATKLLLVDPPTFVEGEPLPAEPNPDPEPGDDSVYVEDPAIAAEEFTTLSEKDIDNAAAALAGANIRVQHAPLLFFHTNEKHWPLSATSFIDRSELRWSHSGCNDHSIDDDIDAGRLSGAYNHRQRGNLFCKHGTASSDLFQADDDDLRPHTKGAPGKARVDVEGMFMDYRADRAPRGGGL